MECYETAEFVDCEWVVSGDKPIEPTLECYETAEFVDCKWIVSGDKPIEPTVECHQTAIFEECEWVIHDEELIEPTVECYQTTEFVDCKWVVSGDKPIEPTVKCYETAEFVDCKWVVSGDKPIEPTLECYETAEFVDCEWVVSGDKPIEPTLECYETAEFVDCKWIVSGDKPAEPILKCYQTATFNSDNCEWVISNDTDTSCECDGQLDALGICNGSCEADTNNDGICDPVPTGKCGVGITLGKGSIQLTGITQQLTFVAIYKRYFGEQLYLCSFNETCDATINLSGLDAGIYTVKILTGEEWGSICQITEYVTIEAGGSSNCIDKDGDGYCVDQDCDDNNAAYPAAVGTKCDDGNTATENDVIQANGCSCAGTPIETPSYCELVELSTDQGILIIDYLDAPTEYIRILDSKGEVAYECTGTCKNTETIPLNPGTYTLSIKMFTAASEYICEINEQITIEEESSLGGNTECQEVDITYGNGEIHIVGEVGNSYFFKVQKQFGSWDLPIDCVSDCGHEVHLTNLEPGKYFIRIYSNSWKNICPIGANQVEGGITIELEGGSLVSTNSRRAAKAPTRNKLSPTTFSVYPNPTSHQMTVDLSGFTGQTLDLTIYNSLMKVVSQQKISPADNQQKIIPVNSYKGGIYFVEIRTKDGLPMTKRVLVLR